MGQMFVSEGQLYKFVRSVLLKTNAREDVATHVAKGLVQASLRGVDSHGVRLLSHYLEGAKKGRINPDPKYRFTKTSPSTGSLDADHTFGHAAGIEAAKKAVELAKKSGSGHVAVYNSTHFGAAAYYALEIAKHDMIGMSFTHADSLMRSHGGKGVFFGTNPIAFAAPCEGEEPFCLDMATSAVTFNKVKQLRESGSKAPPGAGADRFGVETRDPDKIAMLLPAGGYKGYGLSAMVEILCSMLTGMPYGPNIPSMYKASMSEKRFLGHFVSAIRIDCFQDKSKFKKRLSRMMRDVRNQPPFGRGGSVQIAGDPEKTAEDTRSKYGIPLTPGERKSFEAISAEYGIKLDLKGNHER